MDDTPVKYPQIAWENDNEVADVPSTGNNAKPMLKLMRGGKGPPAPPDKDWLSPLPIGTEFLCRDKMGMVAPRWVVIEWIMGGLHRTGNVLLIPAKTPNDTKTWQWVDPKEFCKFFEYRGILEGEDETDGNNT